MKSRIALIAFIFTGMCITLSYSCKKDGDGNNNDNNNDTTNNIKVTDIDGNIYNTVTVGTQVWMVENLKTTKYNDNTSIPLVTNSKEWAALSAPGYCWYFNDRAFYKNTYGALYNWYALNTGKLCPTGWHVPSDAEWTVLSDYLGGESVAGGQLKEITYTHWKSPNLYATNKTGFTALPGGYRYENGPFYYNGDLGIWWSSTEFDNQSAWDRLLDHYTGSIYRSPYSKNYGLSVRCLQD